MSKDTGPTPAGILSRLASSDRLRLRRLEMLPLRGPGAVFSEHQGRQPGDSTTPEELSDLISSIATVGLLQPVLVEELQAEPSDQPRLRLVSGERRMRAMRWGAVHDPDNPRFAALPAVVCPGLLSQAERRVWQLVENLAREDLQPGELATALLLERCAIITAKLAAAGRPLPPEVAALEDPVAQWHALEKLRGANTDCAASWKDVLRQLGLQLSPRKARQLVQAFAALPREITEDMDAAKVALHTRITFAQLHQGRAAAAEQIWAAVKTRNRPDLLPAAVRACAKQPELTPEEALEAAGDLHQAANNARANKLRGPAPETTSAAARRVEPKLISAVLGALRDLTTAVRAGYVLHRYDAGSLRLAIDELLGLVAVSHRHESST